MKTATLAPGAEPAAFVGSIKKGDAADNHPWCLRNGCRWQSFCLASDNGEFEKHLFLERPGGERYLACFCGRGA